MRLCLIFVITFSMLTCTLLKADYPEKSLMLEIALHKDQLQLNAASYDERFAFTTKRLNQIQGLIQKTYTHFLQVGEESDKQESLYAYSKWVFLAQKIKNEAQNLNEKSESLAKQPEVVASLMYIFTFPHLIQM